MSDYTFSTINDREFEELARDLLNAKNQYSLQNFKRGPDRGVDLRYSTPSNDNSLVVQAKHFYQSGLSKLKSVLKNEELPKIKLLQPDRYILVTSLPLSATNKDDLRNLLTPFVKSSNDIIGKEDLNGYLEEFPDVQRRFFKLWFSSVAVFQGILNNAVEGRTRHLLQRIEKRFPFYVITERLDDANRILEKQKLLLISGQPGIGKTTLSEILLLERAKLGFKIYEVTNIREAEDMISQNEDEKQLFYMDDFLGDIHLQLVSSDRTENEITRFVDRVRNTPNKFLLITSRTVVLQAATQKFEKIRRSRLNEDRFELVLENYTKYQKALILYNHLYFGGVHQRHLDAILEDRFYLRIVGHSNYSPRLIEFLTFPKRIEGKFGKAFRDFILTNLNNPSEVWADSFLNEIDYFERCFLYTLFSFGEAIGESDLTNAFNARLDYEKVAHNQKIFTNQFKESAKLLLDGFVVAEMHASGRIFDLVNPSLADFLEAELKESPSELKAIVSSVISREQLTRVDPEVAGFSLTIEVQNLLYKKMMGGEIAEIGINGTFYSENKRYIDLLDHLRRYCRDVDIDEGLVSCLEELDLRQSLYGLDSLLRLVGKNPQTYPKAFQFISDHFIKVIEQATARFDDYDEVEKIPYYFELFGVDFDEYSTYDGSSHLERILEQTVKKKYEETIEDKETDFLDFEEVENELYWVTSEFDLLKDRLLPHSYPNIDDWIPKYDKEAWGPKIAKNIEREAEESTIEDHFVTEPTVDTDSAIDDLFSLLETNNSPTEPSIKQVPSSTNGGDG